MLCSTIFVHGSTCVLTWPPMFVIKKYIMWYLVWPALRSQHFSAGGLYNCIHADYYSNSYFTRCALLEFHGLIHLQKKKW